VPLRRATTGPAKATPAGGKVAGGKRNAKAAVKASAKKASTSKAVQKFVGGGKSTASKKSVPRKLGRKTPTLTPGAPSQSGTAGATTMKAYAKLLKAANNRKH